MRADPVWPATLSYPALRLQQCTSSTLLCCRNRYRIRTYPFQPHKSEPWEVNGWVHHLGSPKALSLRIRLRNSELITQANHVDGLGKKASPSGATDRDLRRRPVAEASCPRETDINRRFQRDGGCRDADIQPLGQAGSSPQKVLQPTATGSIRRRPWSQAPSPVTLHDDRAGPGMPRWWGRGRRRWPV